MQGRGTYVKESQIICKFGEKSSLTFNTKIETIFFLIEPPFGQWLGTERSGLEVVNDGKACMNWKRDTAGRCSRVRFHSRPRRRARLPFCSWVYGFLELLFRKEESSSCGANYFKRALLLRFIFHWLSFRPYTMMGRHSQLNLSAASPESLFIIATWQRKAQERPTSKHSSSHHATPWSRVLPVGG